MRTKSRACLNSRCVGLSDVLDDRYLNPVYDHLPAADPSTLCSRVLESQQLQSAGLPCVDSGLLHNVSLRDVTLSPFGHQNECLQVLEDVAAEMAVSSPHASIFITADSGSLSDNSRIRELPAVLSTGCVPLVRSVLFPIIRCSLFAFSLFGGHLSGCFAPIAARIYRLGV